MPTLSIDVTEHFDHFVNRQVSSGRYGNTSEIVGEALRLLEEKEQEGVAKLETLRLAAKRGFDEIDRGEGILLNGKEAIGKFVSTIEAEVAAKTK